MSPNSSSNLPPSSNAWLPPALLAFLTQSAHVLTRLFQAVSRPRNIAHLNRIIIAISMGLMMLLLVLPHLLMQPILKEGRVVRAVYAQSAMTIEDAEQTAHRRDEAAKSLSPVYREIPGASRIAEDRVVMFLEAVRDVCDNPHSSSAKKRSQLRTLLTEVPVERQDAIFTTLLAPKTWSSLPSATHQTLEVLLQKGLSAEDTNQRRDATIRGFVPETIQKNGPLTDAVVAVVAQKIRPTLTIDEELTEDAREKAVSEVEPVVQVYSKGDLIVQKGEAPSHLQTEALRRQGLLMNGNRLLHALGICLLTAGFLFTIWSYVTHFERKSFFRPNYVSLISTLMVITLGGLVLWNNLFPAYLFLYPVPIFAFMMTVFTSARVAIFISMMVILMGCLALQIPLEMMAILSLSCLAGIVTLLRRPIPKDRFDILNAGLAVGIVQAVTLLIMSLIYQPLSGSDVPQLAINVVMNVASGLFSGIITLGALPLFEKWFKLITPFTLLELSKLDTDILKRMQIEAPGTFHHSLIISTLAEAAAEAIGANGLLARVGCLYHDIGKIKRPLFFVENQAYFGAENPHDKLSCRLSKMIVIAHPRDGVEMGRKLGLPEQILAFMPEHHGTMVAGYFYNKAILEEGEESVDKEQYRYPGPKPQTKETAIVMLADACESATRALRQPTQAQLEERIDKIIKQRIDDHQFSEAPITMREIQIVRDIFLRVLRGMQHNRVEYQQAVIKDFNKAAASTQPGPRAVEFTVTEAAKPVSLPDANPGV
jgi:cyclic-di-AMP phosphodiesterase PgpH